jgi:hypothetical protein
MWEIWMRLVKGSAHLLASAVLTGGLMVALATGAEAAVYTVNSDHCSGGCTPDTSTITATDSGGNLLIQVALAPGDFFMSGPTGNLKNSAGKSTFGFDLDLTSITISSGPASPPWTTDGLGTVNGSFTSGAFAMDGAGKYDYVMNIAGSGPSSVSSLTFTIMGASLTDIIGSSPFAADIISGTTGNTGVVDFSLSGGSTRGGSPVPEPSTWAMMLIGFAGLGYAGYRKTQGRLAPSVA